MSAGVLAPSVRVRRFDRSAALVGDELTTFHAIGALLSTASGIGVAAHLLATNVLGTARVRLPRWLVATGTASAAAWIVQAIAGATSSTGGASSAIGPAAFVSWCAWILGMSQLLWRRESADAAR